MNRPTAPTPPTGFLLRKQGLEATEHQYGAAGPKTQTAPNYDPKQQTAASLHSFDCTTRLHIGVITDTCALAHAYRVQLEKGLPPMVCYGLANTTLAAFGAKDTGTLLPGTEVLCAIHPQLMYGYILGVIPPAQYAANRALGEMVSQTTRQRVDEAHKHPLKMHDNGRISKCLLGRYMDATFVGEQGWVTETGLRIFIDPFMAMLAADEMTGVFVFYHDQLCRIGGYNLQFRSAGYERDSLDDQEENHEYEGWAAYPWEQCGMFTREDPRQKLDPADWQADRPWYSAWENKDDWQQAFHRLQQYRGYLGQGGKTLLSGPPATPPSHYAYEGGQVDPRTVKFPGLFDQSVQLDGRMLVQSAKGISIVKRCGIIVPNRCKRPEQATAATGDGPTTYKHSGLVGDGPDHEITGDLTTTSAHVSVQRAAGILDMHAYMFNYAGLHPFFYHEKDWAVADEGDLPHTEGATVLTPEFMDLQSKNFLAPPDPYTLTLDHRLQDQEFYQNESGIDFLDDGGVVIYDGFGSEIRMTAGSVWISAPGDVWLKAGRNVNHWAGGDLIAKGRRNVDIDCTQNDVRIKAERNMQLVAGNGQIGGILLESRSTGDQYDFDEVGEAAISSGIMFKCPSSYLVGWANNIYLRTGGGNVAPGTITLDANKGAQNIAINAAMVREYLTYGHYQYFGQISTTTDPPIFEAEAANEFSRSMCAIGTSARINGPLTVAGDITNQGWIYVSGGHIATEYAAAHGFFVKTLGGLQLQAAYTTVEDTRTYTGEDLPLQGRSAFDALSEQLYAEKRPGNDALIARAEFTWRTLAHMQTENWQLFEDRWQQMARIEQKTGPMWEENAITTAVAGTMYPYPGKQNWEGDTFHQQELAIFDLEAAHSADRGTPAALAAAYKDHKYGEAIPVSLQGNYPVIQE